LIAALRVMIKFKSNPKNAGMKHINSLLVGLKILKKSHKPNGNADI
jgi:hypothetical protein